MTERLVLSFSAGAATLSFVVFLLCAAGLASTPLLVAASLAVIVAFALRPLETGKVGALRLKREWLISFWIVAVPFGALYLVNAAAPEISPDGSVYHLALVRRYLDHHGFYRLTTSLFSNFPQGMEMLFLAAYAIGRHSAAALVHFLFVLALPAAIIAYSRRFGLGIAGVLAAGLVFVAPVVGIDGSSAYVDVALAFSGFASFYVLEIWAEDRTRNGLLILAGLLSGFCFAIKYTGVAAILFAVVYLAWRKCTVRHLAVLVGSSAILAAPWLLKNWIIVQNPVSPFFNRVFPNPYIHVSFENEFRESMRHFNGAHLSWETPLELTLRGGLLQGTLGPAFLLVPVGIVALRDPRGRRLALAAAFSAAPWFSNIGTRFLIPALPFIALAIALALSRWPRSSIALMLVNAALCWPAVLSLYCAPYSWRISRFPLKAALRITPPQQFIETWAPEIRFARLIQEHTPADAIIYTAQPIMEAYTDRTILLDYAAALNERIRDTLATATAPAMQPSTQVAFHFPEQTARGLRITATAAAREWTVNEIESPAVGRIVASPNGWDSELAYDRQLATAWRAWQPVRAGDRIVAGFTKTTNISSVSFRTRPGDPWPPVTLAIETDSGEWRSLDARPEIETGIAVSDLRGEATQAIRGWGVTHLLIHDQEPLGPDFRTHEEEWNVRLVASEEPVRLYEILPPKTIDTPREVRNNTR